MDRNDLSIIAMDTLVVRVRHEKPVIVEHPDVESTFAEFFEREIQATKKAAEELMELHGPGDIDVTSIWSDDSNNSVLMVVLTTTELASSVVPDEQS